MKSNFKLFIHEPCSENWRTMITKKDGKFCQSCNKDVIDFTKFSDADLINFFKTQNENICGRLNENQLNVEFPIHHSKPKFDFLKKIAASLLILSTFNEIKSQTQNTFKSDSLIKQIDSENLNKFRINSPKKIYISKIKIKLIDTFNNEKINKAMISINGGESKEYIAVNDIFELEIGYIPLGSSVNLTINYPAFEELVTDIDLNSKDTVYSFYLKNKTVNFIKGYVCKKTVKKKKWWQFWKKF